MLNELFFQLRLCAGIGVPSKGRLPGAVEVGLNVETCEHIVECSKIEPKVKLTCVHCQKRRQSGLASGSGTTAVDNPAELNRLICHNLASAALSIQVNFLMAA